MKENLKKLFFAHLTGQLLVIASTLLVPPILLSYWSSEEYGTWAFIAGAAIFFSYVDFGLSVALPHVLVEAGSISVGNAARTFCCMAKNILIRVFLAVIIIFLTGVILGFFIKNNADLIYGLTAIGIAFAMQPIVNLFFSVGRWRRKLWVFVSWDQFFKLLELIIIITLFRYMSVVNSALCLMVAKFLYSTSLVFLHRKWIFFVKNKMPDKKLIIKTKKNGFGNLMTFMGTTMSTQGFMLIAGYAGLNYVALFSTTRTLARLYLQPLSVISATASPRMGLFIAQSKKNQAISVFFFLLISFFILWASSFALEYIFLDDISKFWLKGKVLLNPDLFLLMMIASGFGGISHISITYLQAANKLAHFGVFHFFVVAVAAMVALFCIKDFGIYGVAWAWLGSEFFVAAVSVILIFKGGRKNGS